MSAFFARSCLRTARSSAAVSRNVCSKPNPLVARSGSYYLSSSPMLKTRAFSTSPARHIRRYTQQHEWVDISADGSTGVIGISSYAAAELGDVVYVELPTVGQTVGQGDTVGAVESVKSASDINAPISCEVTAANMLLEENPGTINLVPEDDSAGGGWIARVKLDKGAKEEFEGLMNADEYKTFTGAEE